MILVKHVSDYGGRDLSAILIHLLEKVKEKNENYKMKNNNS